MSLFKTTHVIPFKYIPQKLPVTATLLHIFLLHYFNAPSWLWGVYCTLAAIIWIAKIIAITRQKESTSLLNKPYAEE